MRPADLANEHGMSAQAIRNYERDGILPPSTRSANGYRQYTSVHAAALRTYLALVPAIGYRAAADLMRAINDGDTPAVLTQLDAAHAQLSKPRDPDAGEGSDFTAGTRGARFDSAVATGR